MEAPPDWTELEDRNTTLVCVMTDAPLDKAACTRVARMASGGVARAVDPVFSDVDGDVVFCLASGEGTGDRFTTLAVGTIAATVTAAAIRDAVARLTPGGGRMAIDEFLLRRFERAGRGAGVPAGTVRAGADRRDDARAGHV